MARVKAVFELRGVKGFNDAMANASAEITAQIHAAVRQTAYAVQARAKALAPKDQGDLMRAIAVEGRGSSWRVGVTDRAIPSRGGNRAHQNPSVYGVWYEYGFTTRRIPAHPFMKPAAQAEEPKHHERLAAALQTGLKRAA